MVFVNLPLFYRLLLPAQWQNVPQQGCQEGCRHCCQKALPECLPIEHIVRLVRANAHH